MPDYKFCFPFAAVSGQEKAKEALLLATVNPRVGGVLLSGEKGTAKTTLARGLAQLVPEAPYIEVPLNTTEDRLIGGIDFSASIVRGEPVLFSGLLSLADGGFLYVDEVNLLSNALINPILSVCASGINIVEREGLTASQPARFVLIGSMNPEEGRLRPQLLDRFGLYVNIGSESDVATRRQIVERRLAYEEDPLEFCRVWQNETKQLREKIIRARQSLNKIIMPDSCLKWASQLSATAHAAGHRAEIVLCQTALAIAAWNDQPQVCMDDISLAARYVLPHRMKETLEAKDIATAEAALGEGSPQEAPDFGSAEMDEKNEPDRVDPTLEGKLDDELWQDIVELDQQLKLNLSSFGKVKSPGEGKRLKTASNSRRGRYVRYRLAEGDAADLAMDATLRSAIRHGSDDPNLKIQVKPTDLRWKIREQRTGVSIFFLVDASGSMGAKQRMGATKGAILSLLNEAYQMRDSVGIIAFRKDRADVLLPLTRSIDRAEKQLRSLKTGGTTPLSLGLKKAHDLILAERRRHRDAIHCLVLISDGRANYSQSEQDPFQEAINIAKRFYHEKIYSLVLDTESSYIRLALAKDIAEALGAQYIKLDDITSSSIASEVKSFLANVYD